MKWKLGFILLPLVCLGVAYPPAPPGAYTTKIIRSPKDAAAQSGSLMQKSAGSLAPAYAPYNLTVTPDPNNKQITLGYTVFPIAGPALQFYVTGISGTTNFVDWYVLWTQPYPISTYVQVTLTNRPNGFGAREFYRAFTASTL